MKAVEVFIGGQELTGYTNLTLERKKTDLTGALSLDLFIKSIPTGPTFTEIVRNEKIVVLINRQTAFSGKIDRRRDTCGKDSYKINITARGATKALVDSSQQHPTGTMLTPTNRTVIETLVEPFGVTVDWLADEIDLTRHRFRDGAYVVDELQRMAEMTSLYIYEARNGVLKVRDDIESTTGEPLVLGRNVMTYDAEQEGDQEKTQVQVKGQKTAKENWGEDAVVDRSITIVDDNVPGFAPLTVQLYGDATNELIERRAQYEMNKRATVSKKIKMDVFHVQQSTGEPWDIGDTHYVELPPAGVFGFFEVTELRYMVEAGGQLKTNITLGPAPVKTTITNPIGIATPLSGLPEISEQFISAASRAAQFGITQLTSTWLGPALQAAQDTVDEVNEFLSSVEDVEDAVTPLSFPQRSNGSNT